MVARRCGVIVVSDAGCDPDYTFADLSNAVRRIRIDMGIPIEFDGLEMTKAGQGVTNRHGVLGRIRYTAVDGAGSADGWLLYVKATLVGRRAGRRPELCRAGHFLPARLDQPAVLRRGPLRELSRTG